MRKKYGLGILVVVSCILLYFFLKAVFSGAIVLPQVIQAGFLRVHYYGLFMGLAVASAVVYLHQVAKRFHLATDILDRFAIPVIVSGFLGARIYHVLSALPYYLDHPWQALAIWQGGLSIFGSLLGGLLALVYLLLAQPSSKLFMLPTEEKFSVKLYTILDWLVPGVILGQIVGRFGNLFNYEAFGYPTSLPWKMFVPAQFRPEAFADFAYFHPFFLYEALGNLVIFLALLFLHNRAKKPGQIFYSYIILYGLLRFALEFMRIDSTFIFGQLRLNVLASLVLCLVGLFGLIWPFFRKRAKIAEL